MASQLIIPNGYPVTPSTSKTAVTTNYVNLQGIARPEEMDKLVRSYGDQRIGLEDMIALMGGMKPSYNNTFTHTQDTWFNPFLKASAATAPTSGQTDTTFTVAAEFLDADGKHQLRPNDVLKCSVNEQTILVVSVTDTQFVAQPYKSNWEFDSSFNGVDVSFFVFDNEQVEGGETPSTFISPKADRISGKMSITTESARWTGSSMAQKLWFEAYSASGERLGWVWGDEASYQATVRFKNKIDGKFLWGEQGEGDTLSDGYTGNTGVISAIETYGNILDTGGQPLELDDIDRLTDYNFAINGASEFTVLGGVRRTRSFDDMIASQQARSIDGNYFGDFMNSEEFIKLGFSGFERNNTKFAYKNLGAFSRQDLGGMDGFAYPDFGLVIPMDMSKSTDSTVSGQVPAMCVRYAASPDGSYNRYSETWLTGGTGPAKTNTTDSVTENFRNHAGLQVFGAHRMFLIK